MLIFEWEFYDDLAASRTGRDRESLGNLDEGIGCTENSAGSNRRRLPIIIDEENSVCIRHVRAFMVGYHENEGDGSVRECIYGRDVRIRIEVEFGKMFGFWNKANHVKKAGVEDDDECKTFADLVLSNWTYSNETITSPLDFEVPLYSDQFTKKATSVSDLYQFGSGGDDSDGAVHLIHTSKDRTLLIYNTLIATPTPTPTPTSTDQGGGGGGSEPTPTPTPVGSNGPIAGSFGISFGGGNSGPLPGGSGGAGTGGQVLGASTSTLPNLPAGCTALLHGYMRMEKKNNDPAEVKKLQQFLNAELHLNLPLTGIFDAATDKAVRDFQSAHTEQILTPWHLEGPTGFVYLTTQRWINLMACATLNLPLPTLVPYQGE